MKALTKIGLSLFMLSFAAIFIFFISIIFAIPLWVSSSNSTTPASPATYNPLANYSFAINWTDVANASFQLGSPNGGLTNYTDNTTGLVGYWRLNAVNGTNYTKDFSGYGNDGKLKNYAQCGSGASTCNLTAGKFGNGLQFDGVNDYVDAGNGASLNITNAITVGAWIYQQPEDIPAGSRKTIAAKRTSSPTNNGYLLSLVDDGGTEGYRFWVDGITAKWSTTLLSGQWVYVTGVYNSTKVIIYVNGIERVSTSKTGNIGTTTNALNIGRDVFNGIYFFNGTIDEVRVYNRSLSAQEISTLYNMQYPYYAGTDDSLNGTWAINYTQSSIGGAGVYNYTWFGTDTAGLQNGTQTIGYNITKAIPILTMSNTTNSINTSGMVLYMPFSEGSGASVTEDKSGWGNNGTLTNMNTTGNSTSGWIAGKYGSGLQFDGIDDFVNMGNSSILDIKDTKDIYVSFWFKSNPDTVVRDIIEKYDYVNIKGWKLYMFYSGIDQLNYINYEVNGGGFAGGASNGYGGFSSNKWNNIIFFRNSNNLGIILNGIVVLNDTGSYDFSNIENLTIGEKKGDDSYFNGIIDEVRIYNRSLSADEILAQYNAGYGRYIQNFTQAAIGGAGTYNYTWFATNTTGAQNSTQTVGYKINSILNYYSNTTIYPANYFPTTLTNISINWTDINSTISLVFIESNFSGTPTNYTASLISGNLTSGIWNYNSTLPAGTFYWRSFANASDGVWNSTGQQTFTIDKAATNLILLLNGTDSDQSYNQNNIINITGKINITGLTVNLDLNETGYGTNYKSGTTRVENITSFGNIRTYNITAHYDGNENYTSSFNSYIIQITSNGTLTYSNIKNRIISGSTYIMSNNYSFNATWSWSSSLLSYVIFEFNGTNYTVNSNVSVSSNSSEFYYNYSGDLKVGNYTYYWYANNSQNNWTKTTAQAYEIRKADPTANMILTSSSGWVITSAQYTIITGNSTNLGASDCSYNLYKDGVPVLNPYTQAGNLGTYLFTYNSTLCENYTAGTLNNYLAITSAPSSPGGGGSPTPSCNIGYSLVGGICVPSTIGFTVSPSAININASFTWFQTSSQIIIENTGNQDVNLSVTITSEDGSDKFLSIGTGLQTLNAFDFTLKSPTAFNGGQTYLQLQASIPNNQTGTYRSTLVITNKQNGASVKIPIIISAMPSSPLPLGTIILVFGGIAAFVIIVVVIAARNGRKRKKYY